MMLKSKGLQAQSQLPKVSAQRLGSARVGIVGLILSRLGLIFFPKMKVSARHHLHHYYIYIYTKVSIFTL